MTDPLERRRGWRIWLAIARWLLRRYPAAFRARFGADIESAFERAARDADGRATSPDGGTQRGDRGSAFEAGGALGPPTGWRLVVDTLVTLVRAWRWRRVGARVREASRVHGWAADVRYALRSLLRNPIHSVVAVSTLAVAIGGNAAVFSVAYSVLLRTLPYDAPERTVRVIPAPVYFTGAGTFAVSPTLVAIPQVESATVYTEGGSAYLADAGPAQVVRVTHVDSAFFRVLGARLHLGPGVAGADRGVNRVVLSYGLWERAFGGDPGVVGRRIRLSGHALDVVGVAAPEVDYPAGTDVWVTYPLIGDLLGAASGGDVIARLSDAAAIEDVRAVHESRLRAEYATRGDDFPEFRIPSLVPLRDSLVGSTADALVLLFVASALVLLLGCANLAGLSVARNSDRSAEFALRRALGASGARLTRLIFAEALSLAMVAAGCSIAVAVWGRAGLIRLLPADIPGLAVRPGIELLGFVVLAALAGGIVIGLAPALVSLSRRGVTEAAAAGRVAERSRRMHPGLVALQVGLAVVLVVAATLMGRSAINLHAVPLGFATTDVVTFEVRLPGTDYTDAAAYRRFAEALAARLEGGPGVTAVGLGSRMPLGEGLGVALHVWPENVLESDASQSAVVAHVSPGYFAALGMDVLRGTLSRESGPGAIAVSRSLALRLFGREAVTGERVRVRWSARQEPELSTISAVVADARFRGLESGLTDAMYVPFDERPVPWIAFAVRHDSRSADVAAYVRSAVSDVDARIAPLTLRTMRTAARREVAARDSLALVASLFGAVALFLALLGVHGLIAQSVIRRRREMGVRLAVGARARDLLAMVLRDAVRLSAVGVVAGLLVSLLATRYLASFLWGVTTTDVATYVSVAAGALLSAMIASLSPARRAARVDPIESLRSD